VVRYRPTSGYLLGIAQAPEVPIGSARVRQEASVMGAHYGRIRTGRPSSSPAFSDASVEVAATDPMVG
jgi:hypothetical protein